MGVLDSVRVADTGGFVVVCIVVETDIFKMANVIQDAVVVGMERLEGRGL